MSSRPSCEALDGDRACTGVLAVVVVLLLSSALIDGITREESSNGMETSGAPPVTAAPTTETPEPAPDVGFGDGPPWSGPTWRPVLSGPTASAATGSG